MPKRQYSRKIIAPQVYIVIPSVAYKALFGAEKDDIGPENTYFWKVNTE